LGYRHIRHLCGPAGAARAGPCGTP
jgi:hypothetical protein